MDSRSHYSRGADDRRASPMRSRKRSRSWDRGRRNRRSSYSSSSRSRSRPRARSRTNSSRSYSSRSRSSSRYSSYSSRPRSSRSYSSRSYSVSSSRSRSPRRHRRSRSPSYRRRRLGSELLNSERYHFGNRGNAVLGSSYESKPPGILSDTSGLPWSHQQNPALSGGAAAEGSVFSHPSLLNVPIFQHPLEDWMCGVCSNLNSVKRSECFRCGAEFVNAVSAIPCAEVALVLAQRNAESVLPEKGSADDEGVLALVEIDEAAIEQSVTSVFAARGESCTITDIVIERGDGNKAVGAYVCFATVDEATKLLIFCRCALKISIGAHSDSAVLTFSKAGKTVAGGSRGFLAMRQMASGVGSGGQTSNGAGGVTGGSQLPPELQASQWVRPTTFATAVKEKEYLELLSKHWAQLTADQRRYYDERVKTALQGQKGPNGTAETNTATDQTEEKKGGQAVAVKGASEATIAVPTANTSAASTSALEAVKRRLEEKKRQRAAPAGEVPRSAAASLVVGAAAADGPGAGEVGSSAGPALSLAQRIAQKKVQLQQKKLQQQAQAVDAGVFGVADPSPGSASAPERALGGSVSADDARKSHTGTAVPKGSSPSCSVSAAAERKVLGYFPLPPSLLSRVHLGEVQCTFLYVPQAVAERIFPPGVVHSSAPL